MSYKEKIAPVFYIKYGIIEKIKKELIEKQRYGEVAYIRDCISKINLN